MQLGAEQGLQIVIRVGQRLQLDLPQVQLHGGIGDRNLCVRAAESLLAVECGRKFVCLPAEHRRQLRGQPDGAPGHAVLRQQAKIVPCIGAVAGHGAAIRLCEKLLQAAVQVVFGLNGFHVGVQRGGVLRPAVRRIVQHKD